MTDITWIRSKACESSSCPEWRPDDEEGGTGGVWLRSSDSPAAQIWLDAAELWQLVDAANAGEVIPRP